MFTDDPIEGYEIESVMDNSRTVDIMAAYLKACGLNLVIDYEDNEPLGINDYESDDLEVPACIKDLFTS